MKSEISVVIPNLDNFLDVKKVIFSIDSQDLLPSEIILADSSSSSQIENNIYSYSQSVYLLHETLFPQSSTFITPRA